MIIDSLLDYLETNGIGEVGTDIYLGELPEDKDDIVSAMISPSPEPNKSVPYYTQTIDFWARFKSYDSGIAILKRIFDLLHQAENYEVDGYHVYLSYAMGMIDDLDRDAERRHLFKLTIGVVYRVGVDFS